MIVLDASLVIEWVAERDPTIAPDDADTLFATTVLAPSHWPLEICNALRPDLRSGRLSITDFHHIIDRLDALGVQLQPVMEVDEIGPLAHFAVEHALTAYDAAYVQLALRSGATLATLDGAMRRAATALGISIFPVAES